MTATKTIVVMLVQSSHEIGSKANKQLQKTRPLLMSLSNSYLAKKVISSLCHKNYHERNCYNPCSESDCL